MSLPEIEFCTLCGQRLALNGEVWLELDQRINEYHDFGGIPENQSQGWFPFGPDCAKKLRTRAAETRNRIGGERAHKGK